MPLVLNEEQNMLRDSAKDFCTNSASIAQFRQLRDDKIEAGFDQKTWQQMIELGWTGITVPEEFGGLGFGFLGLGVVLEECGRTLTASPLLSTAIGAAAIADGGSGEQKSALLPKVAEGELLLALAVEESAHHNPYGAATRAEKAGSTYQVTGKKNLRY